MSIATPEGTGPGGAARSGRSDAWSSRVGFFLATLGAAVGLGNIWRFSYSAGENGGGAFLVVYLVFAVVVGLPVLLAELALGRAARTDYLDAMATLAGGARRWRAAGATAVAAALIILSYYCVIAGWALRYFVLYAFDAIAANDTARHGEQFGAFLGDSVAVLAWQLAFLAATAAIVAAGVTRGIEAANKFLMPLLVLIVVALAAYGVSLDGARAAAAFLFSPDWSVLASAQVYRAALGQTLFSIGVGLGVLATYGSYLRGAQRLAGTSAGIALGDTLIALLAGLAIFPAVFTFGIDPAAGPSLAFVALPQVFTAMPGGLAFATAFFFLLTAAAVTSSVSMLEVVVAAIERGGKRSRRRAVVLATLATAALGIPSALGFGVLADWRIGDDNILDAVDRFASHLLLPLGAIAVALFAGWTWRRADALAAAGLTPGALGTLWLVSLRYVAPILIGMILIADWW